MVRVCVWMRTRETKESEATTTSEWVEKQREHSKSDFELAARPWCLHVCQRAESERGETYFAWCGDKQQGWNQSARCPHVALTTHPSARHCMQIEWAPCWQNVNFVLRAINYTNYAWRTSGTQQSQWCLSSESWECSSMYVWIVVLPFDWICFDLLLQFSIFVQFLGIIFVSTKAAIFTPSK
jgi:hypothetical protein